MVGIVRATLLWVMTLNVIHALSHRSGALQLAAEAVRLAEEGHKQAVEKRDQVLREHRGAQERLVVGLEADLRRLPKVG